MKPQANIHNTHGWVVIVLFFAALLTVVDFVLSRHDVYWSSYVYLISTILDFVLWFYIVNELYKREDIKLLLIVLIIASQSLLIFYGFLDPFIIEETPIVIDLIIIGIGLITDIAIIISYSGLFKKYAIIDLACTLGFVILTIIHVLMLYHADEAVIRLLKKPFDVMFFYLLGRPYIALAMALNEHEDSNEE